MNDHIFRHPAYVGWDIVHACNHNCFYCYNYWRTQKEQPSDSCAGQRSEIADFIISGNPAIVLISGGEPLLLFDEIKEYIIRFYNNDIFVRIQTNGSLITEEIAEFCANYKVHLMVSFPSVNETTFEKITNSSNTYSKVIRGMDYLKQQKVIFSPNIVVSKMNLDELEETADFLIDRYNCDKLFISRVTRPSNASDEFDKYELDKNDLTVFFKKCSKIYRKTKVNLRSCGGYPFCIFPDRTSLKMFAKGCGAGKNDYVIDNDGNIRACSRDGNSLGNVFADDFSEIRQRLISWGDRKAIPDKCKGCSVAEECRGGCRMTVPDGQRSGASLDCDANPDAAPKRLPREKRAFMPLWKKYEVKSPLHIVCDGDIYRLTCYYRVAYLNKFETNFLTENKQFCIFDLMKKLGMPPGVARKFILYMLESEIIE